MTERPADRGPVVLDASALLALLQNEPGSDRVARAVHEGAAIGAVNLSEVVAKLSDGGMPDREIHDALDGLGLHVDPFDRELAYAAGQLRPSTRSHGLSLGDRACLALAQRDGVAALTSDRAWEGLVPGVAIEWVR